MSFLDTLNECKEVYGKMVVSSNKLLGNMKEMFDLAHGELESCINLIAEYKGSEEPSSEVPSEDLKEILEELKFTKEQLEKAEELRRCLHPITHAYCPDFGPEGYAEYLKDHYISIGKELALKKSSSDIRIAGHQGKSKGSPRNPDPEPAPVPKKK
tara:strand:+ start:12179 stop:12646 length:468 start_codon:yes stop_codon:yes gene_type:complete